MSIDEFLNTYSFYFQSYKKRSGTSSVPKKYQKEVLDFSQDFILKDNKIFCTENTKKKTYFTLNGNNYFIGESGEIRKRSKTNNITYLVGVK